MCMCIWLGLPSNAFHPFTIYMEAMQNLQCSLRLGTQTKKFKNCHVPQKEKINALCTWGCVCSCKQALFMKQRWSVESCSHFKHHLFISPLCMTDVHRVTHEQSVTEILQLHQHTQAINLIPSTNTPLLSSFKLMECFVTQCCLLCNIHQKKKKLISHLMNFHNCVEH